MLCSTLQVGLLRTVRFLSICSITVLYLTFYSASSACPSRKHVHLCHHASGNMERQAEAGRRYRVEPPRIWWYSFTRYHRRHSSFQWRRNSLLRRIPSSPCRYWRYTARVNASALSRAFPRRSGHQVRKACIRGQL